MTSHKHDSLIKALLAGDVADGALHIAHGEEAHQVYAAPDGGTVTLLHVLAHKRQYDSVEFLLENGAEVNYLDDKGQTAIFMPAISGDHRMVELLLRYGADPNVCESDHNQTPLHAAAQEGHLEVVKTLVAFGGDPDAKAEGGITPLILAAHGRHADVVALLSSGDVIEALRDQITDALKRLNASRRPEATDAYWKSQHIFTEIPPDLSPIERRWWTNAKTRTAREQFYLALTFEKGDKDKGVTPDQKKAAHWFLEAAMDGEPLAMFGIANHYFTGQGVEQNMEAARFWFGKGTEVGSAFCMKTLALMMAKGMGGGRDLARAAKLYCEAGKKLCDPDYPFHSPEKAKKCFEEGAKLGCLESADLLKGM